MSELMQQDWDPRSDVVTRDQRAAYDQMRERCPVAYSDFLGWSLFRHDDIVRVLNDPDTFSSAVSRHISVPNGMDAPAHTVYRRLIEPYFRPERVNAFEPQCRHICVALVESIAKRGQVELVGEFSRSFAVQVQCAFMGWPAAMHEPLQRWALKNHQATFDRDRAAMAAVAVEFEGYVHDLLQARRAGAAPACDDVTASLLRETVAGQPLQDVEIASIVRNWTVGEVGTMSASIGILVQYLAQDTALQQRLRAEPSLLPDAIEEILRMHGPLVNNRRITTRAVEIGGRKIEAGQRISLMWIPANRDGHAFEEPLAFRPDRDQRANLLYGAGIHVCPGAYLARMELRVAMEELLARTSLIELVPGVAPTLAIYPDSGFATLPVRILPAHIR
jgi:cytochrome P450